MSDVTPLVDWSGTDAVAIARQVMQRVIDAKRNGVAVSLAAVMIFDDGDGLESFETTWSEMRASVLGWAGMRLVRAAEADTEDDEREAG